MNCPHCKAELRIASMQELKDRYMRILTCPNTRCKNYKQPVEEQEIFKQNTNE